MDSTQKLTNMLPLGKLQKLQDSFSDLFKFTSVILDREGCAITHPSNWDGFCKFFYSSENWSSDCHFDRLQMLAQSQRTMRTALSICPHTKFATAIIPISFEGEFLGGWAIGQIRIREIAENSKTADISCTLSQRTGIPLADAQMWCNRLPVMDIADFNRLSTFIQSFCEAALSLAGNEAPLASDVVESDSNEDFECGMEPPIKVYAASRKPFDLKGKCLNVILSGSNTDSAINDVLEIIGRDLGVVRAFVFVNIEGAVYSNKYEWRGNASDSAGRPPVNVDIGRKAQAVFECFRKDGMIVTSDISKLSPNLCDVLSDLSEKSVIMFPIWDESGLLGFIGVSDSREREWTAEEIMILWNLSTMVADRIRNDSIPTEGDRSRHSILDMLSHAMYKIVKRTN
ncbi:MAG: PocR ligand-binding domain-containing protein [Synergistaceae bacterium]|jgi:ligand-binding sensor protein|nr:PocR ligand-binding domain-containing protein [Synergistaceae bacterium]